MRDSVKPQQQQQLLMSTTTTTTTTTSLPEKKTLLIAILTQYNFIRVCFSHYYSFTPHIFIPAFALFPHFIFSREYPSFSFPVWCLLSLQIENAYTIIPSSSST
eukprot:TRINITY_DN11078_c0_g1_i3.p2 TRINITY_DN11078_c0_g1~~TRINITY_DN11078_c0_g1_i3.p2  ORF type:complete len:104 (+),score=9.16 TRINITY_DN11078_c0_g1_i3:305-616(+)